jgi:hypothetical protein
VIDTDTDTLATTIGVAAEPRGLAIGVPPELPTSSDPEAPSGLAVAAVASSSVEIVWIDNADDETGFEIERSLDEQV